MTDELICDLTAIMFARELGMPVVEPDTLAALATMQERGLVMGCVTNTVLLEEGILDVLQRLGLLCYLESVVVSSAMGYRKPHASLFQRALDELDATPEGAVFVGDRLFDDISGAKLVGMRAVLTHQYRQEAIDGANPPPDAVIRRLDELPDVLGRMRAN